MSPPPLPPARAPSNREWAPRRDGGPTRRAATPTCCARERRDGCAFAAQEKHWKITRPEVLISVTGGAQDFVLSPRLKRVFDRGLTSAASSTNAWVVTGGTDTGVMKLVASAFVEYGVTTPLIAVTSYGCVKGREAFDRTLNQSRTYTCAERASATGAPLNPYHTQ